MHCRSSRGTLTFQRLSHCVPGECFSSGIERVTVPRDTGPPGGPGAFLAPAERDGQMIEAFPNPESFEPFNALVWRGWFGGRGGGEGGLSPPLKSQRC